MRRLFCILTLVTALALPTFAQSTDSTNAQPQGDEVHGGPSDHHNHFDFLTDAEKAEFIKAHDVAEATDPSLAKEGKSLMDQMKDAHESGEPPSNDLKAKMHVFRDKMDAAMIKADPAVAPIIAKFEAHHHERVSPNGAGGPPATLPAQ